jgi:peptidoglycan/xylan/chitin deacetylase (PgdA/CDA1 family)
MTPKFTYPVAGDNSAKAARVDVTAYTSGDAKWYFNNIAATAGTVYQLSDNYMSNVPTEVDVDFHLSNGSDTYDYVAAPASSGGTWASFSGQVTAPANTVSMTVFHLIQSVGYLVIDNMSVTNGSVTPPPPAKPVINSFSANPTSINSGSSSQLSWSVTGASSTSISPTVGTVTGTSVNVSPTQTTTYVLTATNPGGSVTATTTVTVNQTTPPPAKPVINSFSANPSTITTGSSTQLSWSVTGASSTSIDNGVGVVTGTSVNVSPTQTTTYTLTAINPGGTTTAAITVIVQAATSTTPKPTCSLSANPTSVQSGTPSTLTWSSQNATGGTIDNGVGNVGVSGSKSVSPTQTTTYTGTFNGAGGTTTCSATVTVTAAPPPTNLIPNGNLEQGTTNNPTGWSSDWWGSMKATFQYPVAGNGGGKAAKVIVTNYSSGDAKWSFDHVNDSSHTIYQFSDDYNSNAKTNVSIEFLLSNGQYDYEWLADVPSSGGVWKTFNAQVTVPTNAVSFTILHALTSNGQLTIDNAVLTPVQNSQFAQGMVTLVFDDGLTSQYNNARPILTNAALKATFAIITQGVRDVSGDTASMTWAQIKALNSLGDEIDAHTRTHPMLTTLTTAQQQSEIAGSMSDLKAQGLNPTTFVYPYGDRNDSTDAIVKSSGYIGARGSYYGMNTPTAPKYSLYDIRVDSTTSAATINGWIDQAIADKRWLVLELHDILASGGDEYSITPTVLQNIVNHIKSTGVKVVTLQDGIGLMAQ